LNEIAVLVLSRESRPGASDDSPLRPLEDPKSKVLGDVVVLCEKSINISLAVEWSNILKNPKATLQKHRIIEKGEVEFEELPADWIDVAEYVWNQYAPISADALCCDERLQREVGEHLEDELVG
jgi:hypothetical protein